jgi:processive 1,2-diacylglycerol beta-glucosyltransferase
MKILVLYVSIGTGHKKVAEALRESVNSRYRDWSVDAIDTLKYINPMYHSVVVGTYLNVLKRSLNIYRKIYNASVAGSNISGLSRKLNTLLSRKLKRLLDDYNPSVIVCTHPFTIQMLSSLKEKKNVKAPAIAILTDYVSHSLWLDNSMDAYIVASQSMKDEIVTMGVPDSIIFPYGIPVSQKFLQCTNKQVVLSEFGLENKFTILVMGGGLGFGNIEKTIISLLDCPQDIQIIAVTGTNTRLKKRLEERCKTSDKNVVLLGYTDKINELMDISDLLITKPGGITVSEALVKGLPIFIISPIPGQEEGNAGYLLSRGAARSIEDTNELNSIIDVLTTDPSTLQSMRESSRGLGKPNSANDIITLLDKLASN